MSGQHTIASVDFGDGVYEGEVVDGAMHGHGTMRFHSGDVYVGDLRNDVFHGKGTYRWVDGDEYKGEYQHDQQHGTGIFKSSDGVYTGNWFEDQRSGSGKQTYPDNSIYEGDWQQNLKHGRGKQVMANGASYEGEFVCGKSHGIGIHKNSVGDVYEGDFINDLPHGRGTYRWADGTTYVGYFVEGLKEGEGCERLPDGTWVAGNFIKGEHDQKQPVHKVDPGQVEEHKRLLQDTLERLDLKAVQAEMGDSQGGKAGSGAEGDFRLSASEKKAAPQRAELNDAAEEFTEADFEGWQAMKILGKGSFGAVYECGLRSGKIVCVKIVELGNMTDDSELKALENEINLMRRLRHPHIVRYYGCVEDKAKNTLNIFMEYVTGGTLNHYIKKFKKLPENMVQQWAWQIVSGVEYLHSQNIVHRDIKGDNILVTMEGVVKLADFGCSKQIDDVCSQSHGCKTMVGTPYWMAPEVIKCEPEGYGTKSDVWSVACTIVEMVTGKPAWPECNSMWAAVYKIANSRGLPTEIPKDLDPEMMDFLEKCFERDPNNRPNANELKLHPWLAKFNQ